MRCRSSVAIAACLLVAGFSGCDSTEEVTAPASTSRDVTGFISGITVAGATATLRPGAPPRGMTGPAVAIETNQTVINGGSSLVTLQADASVVRFVVAVDGVDGFWDVRLPAGTASASIAATISIPQHVAAHQFAGTFSVAGSLENFGPAAVQALQVIQVGTGDVQISLSWDRSSDLDLHVVEPGGEEIYFGNRESAEGGVLDLDSNSACFLDGINNENITWPAGAAPTGTYVVRVDNWDSCGEDPIAYVVTVNVGATVQTFQGILTGPGDNGSLGSGVQVATFTH